MTRLQKLRVALTLTLLLWVGVQPQPDVSPTQNIDTPSPSVSKNSGNLQVSSHMKESLVDSLLMQERRSIVPEASRAQEITVPVPASTTTSSSTTSSTTTPPSMEDHSHETTSPQSSPETSNVPPTDGESQAWSTSEASWYGPGFYGNTTACGKTYSDSIQGVAHKTLRCGTLVTFRHGGRSVTVPVIDRGPYIKGRTWDLSARTCRDLGHCYTGSIEWRLGAG